jgi:hypothetical protein
VVKVASTFEAAAGLSFVCDKAVETRTQKCLKTRFASVVAGEMILLECVCEESLRQIFGVFVAGLPLEANIFVGGFPVAGEDCVESAAARELIVAAGGDDCGMVCYRESV